MRRERCGGCGHEYLETILDLGKTPVANTLPRSIDEVETFYDLQLGVCPKCWLVQQLEIVPDDILYSSDYAFFSGASLPKVAYHRALAQRLFHDHRAQAKRFTVEIGCNDGDLLHQFRDLGCTVLGVDPSGPAEQARQRGLPVKIEPFTEATGLEIAGLHGKAGLVLALHVAAHVSDLEDLFRGIDALLAEGGVLVVEVQYLPDLLVGNNFDMVYLEHRAHFSLTSLTNICRRHDLYPVDVRHTPAQSGSISVTLTRDRYAVGASIDAMLDAEHWLRNRSTYAGLQGRAEHIRTSLLRMLHEEVEAGRRVAGFAAPAKATTLLNYCGIGPELVEYIVDTTPFKADKFLPGVKIPIVGRKWDGSASSMYHQTIPAGREMPDTWLCLISNYLGDVLRREWEFTIAGGSWIIPTPFPVLL